MSGKRMYVTLDDGDGNKSRVLVVWLKGQPGMIVKWTSTCSGCTNSVDGQQIGEPLGCKECGFTGKRRNAHWVPLADPERAEAFKKKAQRRTR